MGKKVKTYADGFRDGYDKGLDVAIKINKQSEKDMIPVNKEFNKLRKLVRNL